MPRAPRKMITQTIMGPPKSLLPACGPLGRSLGVREGPSAAPRGRDGRIDGRTVYGRTRVKGSIFLQMGALEHFVKSCSKERGSSLRRVARDSC